MKRTFIISVLMTLCAAAFSQIPADRSEVRAGNRDFKKGKYRDAEIDYRRALVKDSTSVVANYNLAGALYKMEEYDEAAKFIDVAEPSENADVYYNKGNIALQNKNYNTAVEAFKQALLLNPGDMDAKENYVYAKKKLEEQQQNQQNQQNNRNQDQNQDQQNQNKDQDKQNRDQDQGKRDDRSQPQQMSSQAAEQMLKAIQAKEKETQEKVKQEEALKMRSRQKEKNW